MEAALRLALSLLTYTLSQAGPLGMESCELKAVAEVANVEAFYTSSDTVRGCASRVRSDSTQEVHVLNVRESADQVYFQVEHEADLNPNHKVIIIININVPVTVIPSAEGLHPNIYLPVGTFALTPDAQPVPTNSEDLPAESEELLLWAQQTFGNVTSFAELRKPSTIRLTTGAGDIGPDSCSLQDGFSSKGFLEWDSVLEEMKSCQITKQGALMEAHILQIMDDSEDLSSHHTDIKVSTSHPDCVLKDMLLILQSRSERSWTIDSQQHSIKIKTSGNCSFKSFSSHVQKGEQLPSAPEQLVHLAQELGYDKISYIQMPRAGRITLQLQNCGSSDPVTDKPTDPSHGAERPDPLDTMTGGLISMLKPWRCTEDYLTITLVKAYLQALQGVHIQEITLQDPTCGAQEDQSHFFLKTKTNACQTSMEPGTNRVRNQLLLMTSSAEEPILVPFECIIPDVSLEIFPDSQFVASVDSMEAERKTYTQVSVRSQYDNPRVSLLECSLKPAGEERRVLISRDSPQASTVEILEPVEVDDKHKLYRFSFKYRAGQSASACAGVLTCELCMEPEDAGNCPINKLMKTSLEVSLTNPNPLAQDQGLGTSAVLGITCGAFLIGALLTSALWFIYSHTRPSVRKQPVSRKPAASESSSTNHSIGSTQSTPCSTSSMA